MTGAEDLDRYGHWESHPEYGPIWTPPPWCPGWAPYRYGHWAWIGPWGWTWVDDAPWGFAPFHYGRWVMVGGRWCWAPGRYVARPVYAPALVAWIGEAARQRRLAPCWSAGCRWRRASRTTRTTRGGAATGSR